jgi:hypothetical protein
MFHEDCLNRWATVGQTKYPRLAIIARDCFAIEGKLCSDHFNVHTDMVQPLPSLWSASFLPPATFRVRIDRAYSPLTIQEAYLLQPWRLNDVPGVESLLSVAMDAAGNTQPARGTIFWAISLKRPVFCRNRMRKTCEMYAGTYASFGCGVVFLLRSTRGPRGLFAVPAWIIFLLLSPSGTGVDILVHLEGDVLGVGHSFFSVKSRTVWLIVEDGLKW